MWIGGQLPGTEFLHVFEDSNGGLVTVRRGSEMGLVMGIGQDPPTLMDVEAPGGRPARRYVIDGAFYFDWLGPDWVPLSVVARGVPEDVADDVFRAAAAGAVDVSLLPPTWTEIDPPPTELWTVSYENTEGDRFYAVATAGSRSFAMHALAAFSSSAGEMEMVEVSGEPAMLSTARNHELAFWPDDHTTILIVSRDLDSEELIAVAESMERLEPAEWLESLADVAIEEFDPELEAEKQLLPRWVPSELELSRTFFPTVVCCEAPREWIYGEVNASGSLVRGIRLAEGSDNQIPDDLKPLPDSAPPALYEGGFRVGSLRGLPSLSNGFESITVKGLSEAELYEAAEVAVSRDIDDWGSLADELGFVKQFEGEAQLESQFVLREDGSGWWAEDAAVWGDVIEPGDHWVSATFFLSEIDYWMDDGDRWASGLIGDGEVVMAERLGQLVILQGPELTRSNGIPILESIEEVPFSVWMQLHPFYRGFYEGPDTESET